MTAPTSAPQVGEPEFDPVKEALEAAAEALNGCYEVQSYPGDGSSWQDTALAKVRGCLESYRPSPDSEGVEALTLVSPSPEPCSDLSIGELIEWLDAPQYTNGYLDFEAANHMSAAAELLERLVSIPPQTSAGGGGCVLVPREPTEGMLIAGVVANQSRMVSDVYRAMIEAALSERGGVR